MSHFMVAVMAKKPEDLERLLAPYDENLEVESYVRFAKDEIIEMARERQKKLRSRLKEDPRYEVGEWDEAYLKAETDEELYEASIDSEAHYDEDGNELTTYNPLSKWDWYIVGGRYDGLVAVKGADGEGQNMAKISEIDFSYMEPIKREVAEHQWDLLRGQVEPANEEEQLFIHFYSFSGDVHKSKEEYIRSQTTFRPYAFIDSDGNWHEQGSMGWFGMSDETEDGVKTFEDEFDNYVASPEHQDEYMIIVDCHI